MGAEGGHLREGDLRDVVRVRGAHEDVQVDLVHAAVLDEQEVLTEHLHRAGRACEDCTGRGARARTWRACEGIGYVRGCGSEPSRASTTLVRADACPRAPMGRC